MTGPGTPATPKCQPADADHDGDVDLVDFRNFQAAFGAILVMPGCALDSPDPLSREDAP